MVGGAYKADKIEPKELISRFRGQYKFLSNFYVATFVFDGVEYPTVEHAYQERKTLDEDYAKFIREADTPMEAANRGRSDDCPLRSDWYNIKGDVMRPIVREKFIQNEDLAEKLLVTGDAYILEGNYWHDNYFGSCSCKDCHRGEQGLNVLGRILMDVRKSLQKISYP